MSWCNRCPAATIPNAAAKAEAPDERQHTAQSTQDPYDEAMELSSLATTASDDGLGLTPERMRELLELVGVDTGAADDAAELREVLKDYWELVEATEFGIRVVKASLVDSLGLELS